MKRGLTSLNTNTSKNLHQLYMYNSAFLGIRSGVKRLIFIMSESEISSVRYVSVVF